MSSGVLVAADESLEWLLPWWWARYQKYNTHPVVFVDLGLSQFGRAFCAEKGTLITLESDPQLGALPDQAKHWESIFGSTISKNRNQWFKKPFALNMSPFDKTIWLDVDCEVLGPLESLFSLESLALCPETKASQDKEHEQQTIEEGEILYNSGVIVYKKHCPIIAKWAKVVEEEGELFWSDQHALSRIIHRDQCEVLHLDDRYNWRMSQGMNFNAVIVHWVGLWGKQYIRLHGGIGHELEWISP